MTLPTVFEDPQQYGGAMGTTEAAREALRWVRARSAQSAALATYESVCAGVLALTESEIAHV